MDGANATVYLLYVWPSHQTVTVASAPTETGAVLMPRFREYFAQCIRVPILILQNKEVANRLAVNIIKTNERFRET